MPGDSDDGDALAFPKPARREKKARKPLKRTPLKQTRPKRGRPQTPQQRRRAEQRRIYLEEARPGYLRALAKAQRRSTPLCEVCGKHLALEVHHRRGREGELLIDRRYFLGVCRSCHVWIGENPSLAYQHGYSLRRNQV